MNTGKEGLQVTVLRLLAKDSSEYSIDARARIRSKAFAARYKKLNSSIAGTGY